MFAGCHPITWPHHQHSIREENNNIVKPFHSQMTFPYFGKLRMDKTSHKSPNVYSLKGHGQIFNISDFVSEDFRDENKLTAGVQNLSRNNFSIENLVSSSSNTLQQRIHHKQHNTSVTKHHKPKQTNGYSIRDILKPKQDSIPEFEKPDQGRQVVDGENEHIRRNNENEQIHRNNEEKGKKTRQDDDYSFFRQFNPKINSNQPHSAFSVPNPSSVTENFIHNLPTNSSLPVEFLMGNNHSMLRGESSYDPCPYLSDTQSQHISFDPLHHQSLSPLSGHFDELSSSPPLSSITRCYRDRKKFQCPQCRYITDRKNNLMRHIITMHQDSGKVLECCGIAFQSKAALREHNSVFHSGGYRCQICSRNFCRKALLRRHLTVHSGQKDFFCDLCGYATSHKSNLERHQKVHNKRHNRISLLNTSTGPYGSTIINNSNHNINTSHTFSTNKSGALIVSCGRNMERTASPTFLQVNISSNEGYYSDCDIIDVDSLDEHSCVSPTTCSIQQSTIDDNTITISETKDTASPINHQPYFRPKKHKRRGLFVSRIHDTYDVESQPCLYHSYQHHSNKERQGIKHVINHIPDADSEDVKSNNARPCFDIVNEESSFSPTCISNGDATKEDTVNKKHENDVIQHNEEHNVLDLKLRRRFKGNSPRKRKIYPLLYPCHDCHREFPNQILYDSHTCSRKDTNCDYVISIPIVVAVQKGRLSQSNAVDLTI